MGKSKPDQVIVHRLDLQPSLKDSLDNAILIGGAARTLQGLGQAVGGIAAGMGTFLAAGFGAYAAAWAAGEVKERLDKVVQQNRENIAANQIQAHGSVTAFVSSLNWSMTWNEVLAEWRVFLASDLGQSLFYTLPQGDANIMARLYAFLRHFWQERTATASEYIAGTGSFAVDGPKTPTEAWADWYTVEEVINDGVYSETQGQPVRYTVRELTQPSPGNPIFNLALRIATWATTTSLR